jgi:hypothetical protein
MFFYFTVLLCKHRVSKNFVTLFTPCRKVPSVDIRITTGQICSVGTLQFSSFKLCSVVLLYEIVNTATRRCIAVVIDNFLHCYSQHPETAVISDILTDTRGMFPKFAIHILMFLIPYVVMRIIIITMISYL